MLCGADAGGVQGHAGRPAGALPRACVCCGVLGLWVVQCSVVVFCVCSQLLVNQPTLPTERIQPPLTLLPNKQTRPWPSTRRSSSPTCWSLRWSRPRARGATCWWRGSAATSSGRGVSVGEGVVDGAARVGVCLPLPPSPRNPLCRPTRHRPHLHPHHSIPPSFGDLVHLVPHAATIERLTAPCFYCRRWGGVRGGGRGGSGSRPSRSLSPVPTQPQQYIRHTTSPSSPFQTHTPPIPPQSPAAYTVRVAGQRGQQLVGGADLYRPACTRCYHDCTGEGA